MSDECLLPHHSSLITRYSLISNPRSPFMITEQLTQSLSLPANPTHAAAQTASFNSNSVDLSKFERCLAVLDIGAVTGTSPTFDAKWQESPDNVTFTDVT